MRAASASRYVLATALPGVAGASFRAAAGGGIHPCFVPSPALIVAPSTCATDRHLYRPNHRLVQHSSRRILSTTTRRRQREGTRVMTSGASDVEEFGSSVGLSDIQHQGQEAQEEADTKDSTDVSTPFSLPTSWVLEVKRCLARDKKNPTAKYFQIATASVDGGASCRTVVFRGFAEHLSPEANMLHLKMVTDRRSGKVPELGANPRAEVCWYMNKAREQFRISGDVTVVAADEKDEALAKARTVMWKEMSDGARQSFAWPVPGEERAWDDDGEQSRDFDPPPQDASVPVDNFLLLLLRPTCVDHLCLKGSPQRRFLYRWDEEGEGGWTTTRVNP